jgi:hypothetical protein
MRISSLRASALVTGVAALVLGMTACGDDGSSSESTVSAAASPFDGDLVGTFSLDGTVCTDGVFIGSYLRLIEPGGTAENGPFVANEDSPCDDRTYSLLVPGSDRGFVTGGFQPPPDPAFDDAGNGLASSIFQPVVISGVAFAGATDPAGSVPSMTGTNGILAGDLSAFTAYYAGASVSQGAPKPDGSGSAPTGLIQLETGRFVLQWTSELDRHRRR